MIQKRSKMKINAEKEAKQERIGIWSSRPQAGEIEITSIQDIDCAGFDKEFVQDVYVVDLARGNPHHCWDCAVKIEQRMQFHRSFSSARSCPGEECQAQIDGRRIQSVYGLLQFHSKVFAGVKLAGLSDDHLGEVCIDAPVPDRVGICQGVARDLATNAQMIQLHLGCAQAGFDVAQAFPIRQLCESQTEKLVPARESLDLVMASIPVDALVKFVGRKKVHELGA